MTRRQAHTLTPYEASLVRLALLGGFVLGAVWGSLLVYFLF